MMRRFSIHFIITLALWFPTLFAKDAVDATRVGWPQLFGHHQSTPTEPAVVKPLLAQQEKKQITFLVYIAGDNNLNPFIDVDMKEMMKVGSNANMNVLAFINTKLPGKAKSTTQYYVMPNKIVQQGNLAAMDSGSPQTVMKALEWAINNYPSDMFVLILWDHGSGAFNRLPQSVLWRAACYDDTTGSYLTDAAMQQALAYGQKLRGGKKLDIVAFDACLMADVEVAYALAPYANYLVASQETIPGDGYGYDQMLMRPSLGNMTVRQLANYMVASYETAYHGVVDNYTLSALDLSKMSAVTYNIKTLAKLLSDAMKGSQGSALVQAISASRNENNCTHFEAAGHLDIIHFYSNLIVEIQKIVNTAPATFNPIIKMLKDGIKVFSQMIASRVHGDAYPLAHGLSIYFPGDVLDDSYPTTQWGQNTDWVALIKQYLAAVVGA